ncbi:hypothetical protein [Streptomyces sp. TRM68367]|uniref:hypothetical protein n=1 Tax=Streptomyces sp. TRM68367 TaxID=2758415 RepID=UPI00165BBD00|nr:hypothetical protein [Streptomyces sp. TRM68367]MBC9731091.1 hypothetical protein [Streptomyces sp. TRM68367]
MTRLTPLALSVSPDTGCRSAATPPGVDGEPEFEQVPSRDADPDDLPGCLPPVVRVVTGEVPAEGDWPVLALLASANTPLRAKEICEVTQEAADHRHVETLRMRLNRMVRGEWLAEPSRGLFALADGVRAPDRP